MKIILSFLALLCCVNCFAQENKDLKLTGKLLEKQWSKSAASYCAQGSNYFVLETTNQSYVLDTETAEKCGAKQYIDKKVALRGKLTLRKITNTNPMEQKPVTLGDNSTYSCEIVVVKKIESLK